MRELWGLPIGTWLVLVWAALACIDTHNKRIWQAARRGELPEGDSQPPAWMAWISVPQYAALAYLVYLDWRMALWAFVLTFIAAVVLSPVMEAIGAILLLPVAFIVRAPRRSGPTP